MRKIIRLNTHPYPTKVWFTADVEAFQRHRTKITGRAPEEVGLGQCSATDDRGKMVIGVFDGDTSTLVHEIGHAVVNVFHYVGMDINLHTTEAFSYLLDSLYSQANQHLNKSTPAHDGLRTESEQNNERASG